LGRSGSHSPDGHSQRSNHALTGGSVAVREHGIFPPRESCPPEPQTVAF
jgi:hypothetical protein